MIIECRISQDVRNGVNYNDKICLPVYQLILCPRQRMNHKMHWRHFPRSCPVFLTKISKSTLKHLLKIHHNTARTKEHHLKFSSNHHISRGFFRVRFSFSNTCESVHDEKRKKISTWLLRPECWYPCQNQLICGRQKSLSVYQAFFFVTIFGPISNQIIQSLLFSKFVSDSMMF